MDLDNKVRTDDEDSNRLDFLDRRTAFEWLETYEGLGTTFRNLCIWLLSQAVGEKYARWMLGGNRREYAEWKRRMTEAAKKSGHPVLVDAVKARPEYPLGVLVNPTPTLNLEEVQHHEQHESADSD